MRFGMILPGGSAGEQLEQAALAERSGWDGVFVWEGPYGVDAWTLLGAMAVVTERVRLGTLLTPLPWRRPWKVASQVVTVDQLSGGRVILTVGLGALTPDLPVTGEVTGLRERADLLDEGLDLMRALWSGEESFHGTHYRYDVEQDDQLARAGRPVQDRIPIWTVAVHPRPKSMRRVLRCEGIVPQYDGEDVAGNLRAVRSWLAEHGAASTVDIISQGETPTGDPAAARAVVEPLRDAGATWWLETNWEMPHHSPERMRQVRDRLAAGPPVLSSSPSVR